MNESELIVCVDEAKTDEPSTLMKLIARLVNCKARKILGSRPDNHLASSEVRLERTENCGCYPNA